MKKKGGGGDEGGSWMDTYGDLVTLLLCFFVLLYSMSTMDSAKWDLFVKSIYPNGRPGDQTAEQIIINGEVTNKHDVDELVADPEAPENVVPDDAEDLYLMIAEALSEAGVEGVSVSEGADYTFVVFQDKAFFDGDSSVLTEQGQETLDIFCNVIGQFDEKIGQVNVMGHTAQADPSRLNSPRNDRMLSVMRAAEVCIFIQTRDVVAPEKLISIGYGQFRPVASNDTPEGRAKNRRVEILLIDEGADVRDLNQYVEEHYSENNEERTIVTGAGNASQVAQQGAGTE